MVCTWSLTEQPADFTVRLKDLRVMEGETAEFVVELTQENIQVRLSLQSASIWPAV